jgi:hypothetical protein
VAGSEAGKSWGVTRVAVQMGAVTEIDKRYPATKNMTAINFITVAADLMLTIQAKL